MTPTDDVTLHTGTNLGPAVRGRRFRQRFVAREDGLSGVSVWAATYHGRIRSTARLALLDEGGRVLRERELDTAGFTDNTWQRFSFEPVPESAGCAFVFEFETDGEGEAITLWTSTNAGEPCAENGVARDDTICHETHYAPRSYVLLDPLLRRHAAEAGELDGARREALHEILLHCVARKEYFFLRLAHLLDAFGRTEGVASVLSIGCGTGHHEAYLAARFPHLRVDATDRTLPQTAFDVPNLAFDELDVLAAPEPDRYDLVFSIECLEHIPDYRTAFRNMAAKVRPGGFFYLSVPFATREEQRDEALIRYAWEAHEHVLPGFDFETLEGYFAEERLDVVHATNMFDPRVAHPINALLHKLDAATIEAGLDEIVALFLLDLYDRRVDTHRRSEGVRFLGRKRD